MRNGESKEPGKVIPFERGAELESERAKLSARLQSHIDQMTVHYQEWARVMADSFDNAVEEKLIPKLEALRNQIKTGTRFLENIKTATTQEVRDFINQEYKIKNLR